MRKKEKRKTTNPYAGEKRWVFSFDIKEQCEEECPTETGRVLDHRSDVFKRSALPRNTEYPRVREESEGSKERVT